LPLSEKARIEVYLPDLPRPAYQDLLSAFEEELTFAFGGCTTMRGLEGNYLSRAGTIVRDRINIVYADMPFSIVDDLSLIGHYADQLRDASLRALDEEAVLIAVIRAQHSE
jgi:hypothetical protein